MALEISRSEQKRRLKYLEKLVAELSKLSRGVLKKIPCNDEIKDLLGEVSSLKGSARKRQLKYITKILRDEPADDLYDFISKRQGDALEKNKLSHEVEYLRDSLLNEALEQDQLLRTQGMELPENWPSEVVEDIHGRLLDIDTMALKRLANHFARTRNRRHSREIFRIIKSAIDDAALGK